MMVIVGGVVELAPLIVMLASPICTVSVVEAEFCVTDIGREVAAAGLC